MPVLRESKSLIWLTSALIEKKGRIATLLSRLAGLECPGDAKPGLSAKFLNLLQQIDAERGKEFDLICEIQDVEEKHLERRLRRQLERADPDYELDYAGDHFCGGKEPKHRKGLWWFFAPLFGDDTNHIDNDKQDLRLD